LGEHDDGLAERNIRETAMPFGAETVKKNGTGPRSSLADEEGGGGMKIIL
jgi:hypothetical protein